MTPAETAPGAGPARARWAVPYARYAVGLLFLAYLVNYMDRIAISVLTQPIKLSLGLSDTQVGLLTGPAFALTYASCGLFLGQWADRGNRSHVLTVAVAIWSGATALCGMAAGFFQLFACRILVGFGEAGGTPTCISLVADYFPKERRSSAYSALLAGAPAGIFLGSMLAGLVGQSFGWRWAFAIIGLPGFVLAGLVYFTLRDPRAAAPRPASPQRPDLRALAGGLIGSVSLILRIPTARQLLLSTATGALTSQGLFAWMPAFFMRYHHMNLNQTGRWFGIGTGGGMLVGIVIGGLFGDLLTRRHVRWMVLFPLILSVVTLPLLVVTLTTADTVVSLSAYTAFNLIGALPLGMSLNAFQSCLPARVRAMGGALLMFATSVLGIGTASMIIGMVSDRVHASTGRDGLAAALLISVATGLWSMVHAALALRTIEDDVRKAEDA
ncbi:MAG: MFS transporter [Caulobacteraceae bacterium]|nr:MFS transporter [Caulobacteraceae bacterium]